MKRCLAVVSVSLMTGLLGSVGARAQSPFDGTWKIQVPLPSQPDIYLLQDGTFNCKTCFVPINVKADAQDHPVAGSSYVDTVSIKVVDDHTIVQTDKKDGKIVEVTTQTVSPNGRTLTLDFTRSVASGDPVKFQEVQTRVAQGPPGSHAISGSWQTTKLEYEKPRTVTYTIVGDSLTWDASNGQSYTARLDGTEAPFHGDPGMTSVSVKRIDNSTIEGIGKFDGRVVVTWRSTVSPDGSTMTTLVEDKETQKTHKNVAQKQ